MERMVLAYSGGLDTSCILKWNHDKGYEVIPYTADLGQEEDFETIKEKARAIVGREVIVKDLKREFVTDFIFPAVRANARYEGMYLLGTSLARPLIAKAQVELAKETGAFVLSHGATGKGNDQVRFELAYRTLMPEAKIYAPWKDSDFIWDAVGREGLMEYAEMHGIEIKQSRDEPWSSDDNAMHISYEAGMLEDPLSVPREDMFQMTVSPQGAPDKEAVLEIDFERGNPVRVRRIEDWKLGRNGIPRDVVYAEECTDPVDIMEYLNRSAGGNGVGRIDIVENRYVGIKSRGVYETPGGSVLHFAHRDLEGITLDKEVLKRNLHTSLDLAERIYSGYWFSPERKLMQEEIDRTQEHVNGFVRVGLYKGNILARGRFSPDSLYDVELATMEGDGGFDQVNARGFIDINALRLQTNAEMGRVLV